MRNIISQINLAVFVKRESKGERNALQPAEDWLACSQSGDE